MKKIVTIAALWLWYLINSYAQHPKNQIEIGYPGIYFFDNLPMRFNKTNFANWYSADNFNYTDTRYFNKNKSGIQIGFYNFYVGDYMKLFKTEPPLTCIGRAFTAIHLNYKHRVFNKKYAHIHLKAGGVYRYNGHEMYTNAEDVVVKDVLSNSNGFKSQFGINTGIEPQLRFFNRLTLGLDISYQYYFFKLSPKEQKQEHPTTPHSNFCFGGKIGVLF